MHGGLFAFYTVVSERRAVDSGRRGVPQRRSKLSAGVPAMWVRHVDGPARWTLDRRLPRGLPQQYRATHPRTARDRRSAEGNGHQLVDGQIRPDNAWWRGPKTLVAAARSGSWNVRGNAQQRTAVRPVPERPRRPQTRTSDSLQCHAG